ncbi:MAG: polynucleotide adenylyltransferase, partial [Candidatus Ornithospirochaeta sp.]
KSTYYSHEIIGSEMASNIMSRLKSSNKDRDEVALLIREHMIQYTSSWTDAAVRRLIVRVGKDNLDNLFLLRECDRKATLALPDSFNDDELKSRVAKELSSSPALTLKDLKVNGRDISNLTGNGPLTGKVLKALLDMVIEEPSLNEREILLEKAKELSLASL